MAEPAYQRKEKKMNLSPRIRKIATIPTISIALLSGCAKQPEGFVVARKASSEVLVDRFEKIAKDRVSASFT